MREVHVVPPGHVAHPTGQGARLPLLPSRGGNGTKKLIFLVAVVLFSIIPARAQSVPAGTTINMTLVSGETGRVSSPLNVNNVSVVGGGTVWLYVASNNTGFIVFNTPSLASQATVTDVVRTLDTHGFVSDIKVGFSGTTADGQEYVGLLEMTFTYFYSAGGGGRGGAGAGWRYVVGGGSASVTFN
jgi:hypothetical protein